MFVGETELFWESRVSRLNEYNPGSSHLLYSVVFPERSHMRFVKIIYHSVPIKDIQIKMCVCVDG